MGGAVHNVFVYGSLLADEVVSIVLERVPPSSAAVLPHFHRFSIRGRDYPAILPAENDKVQGKVLFGLNDEELKLLDDFEDVEYTRQVVEPLLLEVDGKLQSYVYVWTAIEADQLFGDWDYEMKGSMYIHHFNSQRHFPSQQWEMENLDHVLSICPT